MSFPLHSEINLIRSDPLSHFLTSTLKLTPVKIGVIVFMIGCIWRFVPHFLKMDSYPSVDAFALSFILPLQKTPVF